MFRKFAFLLLVLQLTACSELKNLAGAIDAPLSTAEVADGLKQALRIGISDGSDKLSQVNGYFESPYRILLPENVRTVTDKLKKVPGFNAIENEMLKLLNRAAEDAAQSAKPIFVDAIKQMTFQDAMDILMGEKDAATSYLQRATRQQLYTAFQPVIQQSLDRVNASKYWRDAVTAYNKIPFLQPANPEIDDYVTNEALDGLFSMVEVKERSIRSDVSERTTDLLRKVFKKQDTI